MTGRMMSALSRKSVPFLKPPFTMPRLSVSTIFSPLLPAGTQSFGMTLEQALLA